MVTIRGIVKATNAVLNIGIGFKPDFVRVLNGTERTELVFDSRSTKEQPYGMTVAADGVKADAASEAAGIALYDGEGPLEADSTTELKEDRSDKKGSVTKFIIDDSANKTGHFDAALDTDKVGVGSVVVLDAEGQEGHDAVITALTNDGDAANEVTLSSLPAAHMSGMANQVCKIMGMYDYVGGKAGQSVPAGFTIGASAAVNANDGDTLLIEAGQYDNT